MKRVQRSVVGTAARETDIVMPTDGRLPYTIACRWRRSIEGY
jgi:hypothetical protein